MKKTSFRGGRGGFRRGVGFGKLGFGSVVEKVVMDFGFRVDFCRL